MKLILLNAKFAISGGFGRRRQHDNFDRVLYVIVVIFAIEKKSLNLGTPIPMRILQCQ